MHKSDISNSCVHMVASTSSVTTTDFNKPLFVTKMTRALGGDNTGRQYLNLAIVLEEGSCDILGNVQVNVNLRHDRRILHHKTTKMRLNNWNFIAKHGGDRHRVDYGDVGTNAYNTITTKEWIP